MILSFWHSCIFPAIYVWRNLQIRVMSSDSFDGEWTGRIIRKFGFVKVRGSSSRGAVRGLLGMRKEVEQNSTVAFTIDGPRGPRYVAKPGPVLLARATGAPMVAFHIAVENVWTLNTWDKVMIPKPFSRALLRISRQIMVPANADDAERERFHEELQAALDRVREFAEAAFAHVDLDWEKYVKHDPRYERPAEVDLLIGDASKAKKVLGWEPKVRFKDLVRIMVDADMELLSRETPRKHLGKLP